MNLNQFLRIIEIRTKIISVSTLLIAHLYVLMVKGSLDVFMLMLVACASLLVDMGTTAFNSYFDYVRKVDSSRIKRESEKVLVYEGVPPALALWTGAAMFGLALIPGMLIVFRAGWIILVLGVLSLSAGYLYSGGPLPVSRTPFGEIFAGGFLGTILFMVVTISQGIDPGVRELAASLPSFIHIAGILTVNNTCDIEGDRAAGRKTLSILTGVSTAGIIIALEVLFSYILVFTVIPVSIPALLIAIPGLAVSAYAYLSMVRSGFSHETKASSMGKISLSFTAYTLVYSVLLVLSFLQAA